MFLVLIVLVFSVDGLDFEGVFIFVVSIMSNVGVGFGEFGLFKYLGLVGVFGYLVVVFLMVIGRILIILVFVVMGGIGELVQSVI